MPTPFSIDLRWRIVWLHLSTNYAPPKIAQIMSVSEHTVWRYISLFRRTDDVQPHKRRNGPRMLMGDFEQISNERKHLHSSLIPPPFLKTYHCTLLTTDLGRLSTQTPEKAPTQTPHACTCTL